MTSTMKRWRVALVFEIDAESDVEAWDRGDAMVSDVDGSEYHAIYVATDTDDRGREPLGPQ